METITGANTMRRAQAITDDRIFFKSHLLLLIGPAMLLGGRRRMFAGFSAGAVAEALCSLAPVGRGGISAY
jgi:hypothetical protein